jgi:hypothetical protein
MASITNSKRKKLLMAVEMFRQGATDRKVAQTLHMSFTDTTLARKIFDGEVNLKVLEDNDQKAQPASLGSQDSENEMIAEAYKMFLANKMPVEVAIVLRRRLDFVNELYTEYMDSITSFRFGQLYKSYDQSKIDAILKVSDFIKSQKMDPLYVDKCITHVLKTYKYDVSLQELIQKERNAQSALEKKLGELYEIEELIKEKNAVAEKLYDICSEKEEELSEINTRMETLQKYYPFLFRRHMNVRP